MIEYSALWLARVNIDDSVWRHDKRGKNDME